MSDANWLQIFNQPIFWQTLSQNLPPKQASSEQDLIKAIEKTETSIKSSPSKLAFFQDLQTKIANKQTHLEPKLQDLIMLLDLEGK